MALAELSNETLGYGEKTTKKVALRLMSSYPAYVDEINQPSRDFAYEEYEFVKPENL